MSSRNTAFSPDTLAASLARLPVASGHVVALSGGGDSTALLLAFHELALDVPLRAIHVGHGLHSDAGDWAELCRELCHGLEIPLDVVEVEVSDEAGRGPEAAARNARYAALEERLGPGEMLLTGHHRDDQGETVLLHLMRGSGLEGLSGMTSCRAFGAGWLARPLLDVPRAALRAWLEARGRHWVEDPDNDNLQRGRNFLRHRVLPLLASRWPGASESAARAADNLRDAREALEGWARAELAMAVTPAGDGLRLEPLAGLDGPRVRQVLRCWLRDAGMPLPDHRQLAELEAQALEGRPDADIHVTWPGCEVRRYRDVLYAMEPIEREAGWPRVAWCTREPLDLPGGLGRLALVTRDRPPEWNLEVSFRRGGERIRLPGRDHHTDLKSLLQDMGVPPWQRGRVPLVFDAGELAAVGDWRFSAEFAKRLRQAGARIAWETA